ncbi:PD-(D/E)XK nuclease family protein [Enterococcus pallens]|uniref:Helicase-exonuclease AddAB, AddB subunit n=1 Tax=Enterococcus pallens ATCC BAA-351 TaxID=1158607 RepID=R2SJZ2_9ENTE|nr:PD-(D/E)XK nuclease family protein [Enterococcus pallens]EOH88504.1 helicase-exonuclease AddAB, AddB subunit [Enterococcus pallens ATCC BAA-351]EOU17685.1 helicase-exonuclease AddAB, AddB subunit [Enterococcus pallens ATCC BAA-351]OJG81561.1 helicase-exonuclease AddAB, AddB subunit [Enterococcus pallens]
MSLQFLLGTGQNNAQKKMVITAQQWLDKDPENRVFFIVPNYNKFEQEIQLLETMKDQKEYSSIRAQVFSFERLAWYFLQKQGKIPGNVLSDSGNAMILRKVLQEQREKLVIFRGEANKTGFIQQLVQFYREMQIGNVSVEDLNQLTGNQDEQLKLADLRLIYQEYETALFKHQVKNEDPLLLLYNLLQDQTIKNSLFILTGFSRFNAREQNILSTLMKCGHLLVSLELDRGYPNEEPHPLNLFADSGKTYYQLKQLADQQQLPVHHDQKAEAQNTPLNQLSLFWQGKKVPKLEENQTIKIWQQLSAADEVRHIGNEIRRLVSEENYRYKDIQVLIRNFDCYSSVLPSLFNQLAIPFYLDETQKMISHPLVEFLQALFLVDSYNYRINDVFRLLRTELFVPFDWQEDRRTKLIELREKIDQTENVCLAYNFRGSFWTKDEDWVFVDYDFEEESFNDATDLQIITNEVRQMVQKQLPPFFTTIKKAENGLTAAKCFYQLLEEVGIKQQLLFWRDQEVEKGNLEKARNHEQTWQALMDLLDEYVLIYGESAFNWADFQEIFLEGLTNLTYGKIPTAIDQVKVNNLELARVNQAKVTFAIGLNDQEFPARFDDRGLLSPEEREGINAELAEGKFLPENNSSNVNREPFLAYRVFLSGSEKLYLTVATTIDGEKQLAISPFLRRISEGLGIPVRIFSGLNLTTLPTEYVGTLRTLLSDLIHLNRLSLDQAEPMRSGWRQLMHFIETTELADLTKRVFSSLEALNIPQFLQPQTAEKLYGKNLYVSVSRIENFYNCQYKYFAQFGLGLKERTIYGLTPAAAGDFYHEALDRFFRMIHQQGLALVDLTEAQRTVLADQVLKEIFGEVKFAILSSSARMNYIRYQLAQTIQKVSWGLVQQSLKTNLRPQRTEVLFGSLAGEKGIPGIQLPLKNGGELAVRGKIDRLDQIQGDHANWLSVVDYKSSDRSFNVVDAYYGIAMQLITYLDVAVNDFNLTSDKLIKPAGAYYLHVHNPVLTDPKKLEQETLKAYKYDGLFAKDAELFAEMDHSLEEKENSLLFPLRKDAKGQILPAGPSKDKFYDQPEIDLLREYNRKKIQEAGNEILSGEIKLNPSFKDSKRIACQYCPFRSVCKFDVMLKENNYHRLEKMPREEVLKRMEEELHDE